MSAAGGDTQASGPSLHGMAAILFTVIGSTGNALLALLPLGIVHHGVGAGAVPALRLLVVSHACWGVAQLLPITPFHVGTRLSARLKPAVRFAHAAASAVLVLAVGLLAVNHDYPPAVIGLVVFASTGCIRALREAYREMLDSHAGLDSVIRDAGLALTKGQPLRAFELSGRGLATAMSARSRNALWKTMAWSGIGTADPLLTHDALLHLAPEAIDLHLLASYLGCCNRLDEAIELLEDARLAGQGSPECFRLLADLLFRRGDSAAVLALARGKDSTLSPEDRNAIELAVALSPSV
ncbi:MAG TPA: hypothetical protein VHC69_13390 [Polyangiaceae bacterium]|nr:hypothetical protein [Polyangiaceae bacterium]